MVKKKNIHDFERHRRLVAAGQVWSIETEQDDMPRTYIEVERVVSLDPLRFSYFILRPLHAEAVKWGSSSYSKSTGEYTYGRRKRTMVKLSHLLRTEKRGQLRILPERGEAWALYKNWKADWNEETKDEDIQKYQLVAVLERKNDGVVVAPLVRYGRYPVFGLHYDPARVRIIPTAELERFSHQIPSFAKTGREPFDGCLQLDIKYLHNTHFEPEQP